MKSRVRILFTLATAALLPFLPVPAEPGGGTMREQAQPQPRAAGVGASQAELKNAVSLLGKTRGEMAMALKKQQALTTNAKAQVAAALKLAQEPGAANAQKVEAIRKSLEGAMKELEAQDKLGNFEIQRLMSAFNQAETLASNVQKKLDDTNKGIIQKIN
jgi:hypothetical protein